MPRPNQARTLDIDRAVAYRMTRLCKDKGWKFPELAERMAAEGCPIQVSALYKMVDTETPRTLKAVELVAMARVFDLSVEDLTTPKALIDQREAASIAQQIPRAREALESAVSEALRLYVDYGRLASESADLREFMDHQARTGWDALGLPPSVDLGDLITQDEADALAIKLEDVWAGIVHLGRKSAGLEDRDTN